MENNSNLELSQTNSTAKVDCSTGMICPTEARKVCKGQVKEIVEFCNMKKIMRHLAPKDTQDEPRVTLDLVMDGIEAETQAEIEKEVDVLMNKIKALMQKSI